MSNCDVADKSLQSRFRKDLRDKTHIFVYGKFFSVRSCDTCGFLSAVLKCIESKVSELRYFFSRSPNSKDATLILRTFFSWKKVVV
jgi:hypothetical protein